MSAWKCTFCKIWWSTSVAVSDHISRCPPAQKSSPSVAKKVCVVVPIVGAALAAFFFIPNDLIEQYFHPLP